MERPAAPPPEAAHQPEPEILFPDELWEGEKRSREFQALYRQIKHLRDRCDSLKSDQGKTFAQTTYHNAYHLISAAYFLLANADDISHSGRPMANPAPVSAELRAEFIQEIKQVLNSLGIEPQDLR